MLLSNQTVMPPKLPSEIAFHIGDTPIKWYAIFVTGGMILALFLLIYLMKRKKDEYTVDDALEVFLFAIPFAIIFARLGYVIPRLGTPEFDSFREILGINSDGSLGLAGLTIVVGVPGGALGILIYCLIRKKSPFRVFDTIVPCLLLGQVVGRWGNFFNQELFGLPITNPTFQHFPFAVYIESPRAHGVDMDAGWFCANFFYEGTLNFIALVVVLLLIFKCSKKLKVGTLTIGYIAWYGIVRGCLEFIKVGQLKTSGGVGVIQIMCFVAAAIGIVLLVLVQKGIIKLESEKMRSRHFIVTHIEDETLSNNNKYEVVSEVDVRDDYATISKDSEENE